MKKTRVAVALILGSVFCAGLQAPLADCQKRYASYQEKLKQSQVIAHHAGLTIGLGGYTTQAQGNGPTQVQEGKVITNIGLATMAMIYASSQLPSKEKSDAQEMTRLLSLAENPSSEQAHSGLLKLDLLDLIGESPLLDAQDPYALLHALRRGDLDERFCTKNKLMNLAEVRESLEQDIVAHPEEFRSEQYERSEQLLDQLEKRTQ